MDQETARRIDRRIASARASLMSNARWRKLFLLLNTLEEPLPYIHWKFIYDERIFQEPVPGDGNLLERGFGDAMPYPHGPYREIEWILIPAFCSDPRADKKRPLPHRAVDLDGIAYVVSSAGSFPLERLPRGIRISGYLW